MIKKKYFNSKGRFAVALLSVTLTAAGGITGLVGTGVLTPLTAYADDNAVNGDGDVLNSRDKSGTDSINSGDQSGDDSSNVGNQSESDETNSENQSGDDSSESGDQSTDNASDSGEQSGDDTSNEGSQSGDDSIKDDGQTSDDSEIDGNQAMDDTTDDNQNKDESSSNDEQVKSYNMYIKILDQKGNHIPGASIDVREGWEGAVKKVNGSETALIEGSNFYLSNLQLPKGFMLPKNKDYTMFNSIDYCIADYGSGLELSHKHVSLGAGGYEIEEPPAYFYDDHIAMEKNADGSYTTSVKIDVAYYNDIGGNISGEEDPSIDDEYVIGSGETVTLIFKRVLNDNETFSHFSYLSYEGPNESKEAWSIRINDDYFIKPGSVQVELTAKYLEKLGTGTHIFNAHFDDSTIPVQAKIKIVDKKESSNTSNVNSVTPISGNVSSGGSSVTTTKAAPTGVGGDMYIWSCVAAAAGSVLSGAIIKRRKNGKY